MKITFLPLREVKEWESFQATKAGERSHACCKEKGKNTSTFKTGSIRGRTVALSQDPLRMQTGKHRTISSKLQRTGDLKRQPITIRRVTLGNRKCCGE